MADTDTGTDTGTDTAIHDPATMHSPLPAAEGEPRSPPPAATSATATATTTAPLPPPTKTDEPPAPAPAPAPAPPPPPPTPQTDTPTPRLDRLPRPKVQAKIRTTMQRDDISAHEAQRRHLNNERNRRTRQRKIEREIASGVRHRDGRVRRSRERPWC